jgi:hypothetical protein
MADREEWIKFKRKNYHSHLSEIVNGVNKQNFNKFSKYEVEFLLKWANIFDAKISAVSSFKKLHFESQTAKTATLYVKVNPADMLEITYSEGVMLEQIANYFGFRLVQRIRFEADHEFGKNANLKPALKPEKPIASQAELNKLKAELDKNISDESLRQKLIELYKSL